LEFFEKYGLLLVFVVAATPFVQQPAIILASLADTPLFELVAVIFLGRLIKFLIMAYIGSHAPRLLTKMWGVKGELKDVGIKLK
jgi:membrane protein YqaA with SNARE-associated domain